MSSAAAKIWAIASRLLFSGNQENNAASVIDERDCKGEAGLSIFIANGD